MTARDYAETRQNPKHTEDNNPGGWGLLPSPLSCRSGEPPVPGRNGKPEDCLQGP